MQQQIANRDTIKPLVDQLYKKVENTIFKTALQRMKRYYPFNDNNEFKLRIDNNDLTDSIIRNVALILIENAQNNDIGNCGSGVQSAVYFAISLATSMNEDANYLVGIEEPELNMHPQSQRQLMESLKNTIKYPNTQFALTTHSPVIIDQLGHSAIALCRKSKGSTRDVITTVTQIGTDFWDKYQMQEERYYNFFEYKNSDFFFSKYIIIMESSIDCGVLTELLNKYGIDPDDVGISFVPANGEKSVKYPYALTKELGIPFLCVVDRDVFQPYTGEDRKSSLDTRGIPQYKTEAKTSAPFCDLLNTEDIARLLDLQIHDKYKATLNLLENYSIIMMRYALEVDLIMCDSYCQAFCDALHVQGHDRTSHYLLTNMNKRIKALDVLRQVLSTTSTKNLPISYKRIMQYIRDMINN
jgi:putative ATP-dependent endonuclease of OLD family